MEIKNLATIFKGPMDKLLTLIGSEVKQVFANRLLEYQVEEYKRNYFSKTILHRAEPKPLKDFYQPLYIRGVADRRDAKVPTHSVSKLLKKSKYLTIIGNAGSGKSTIIKYLYTNAFQETYKIPIKIELRYLNEYKGRLHEYITSEIFTFHKLGVSPMIIDRMLDSDSFIFFFDGYDEINSNIKSQTTKDIDSFVTKYPSNDFVITSRPHTNVDLLPMFANYYVCDLEENEIGAFIKKQIPSDESELAEKMIKAINKSENMGYKTFLSNPLLLSMFILTFQSYSDIPQKRSEFYHQVFDTLFSVHDSMSKMAYVRERLSGLSKDQFEEILRLYCFISFFEEKFVFSSNYIAEKFNTIKSKKKNVQFDNSLLLDDLQVAIGILNKEGLDYVFPHRSLQEYFAAAYIEKLGVDNKISFYKKLKLDITKDYEMLMERDHFFQLLSEMDYNDCSKFLTIPLLEDVHREVLKSEQVDNRVAYTAYGKILLCFYVLLKSRDLHSEIHHQILTEDVRYIFYRADQNLFEWDQEKEKRSIEPGNMLHQANFPLMREKITFFRKDGLNIINRLKQSIDDIDKSDKEILNLI